MHDAAALSQPDVETLTDQLAEQWQQKADGGDAAQPRVASIQNIDLQHSGGPQHVQLAAAVTPPISNALHISPGPANLHSHAGRELDGPSSLLPAHMITLEAQKQQKSPTHSCAPPSSHPSAATVNTSFGPCNKSDKKPSLLPARTASDEKCSAERVVESLSVSSRSSSPVQQQPAVALAAVQAAHQATPAALNASRSRAPSKGNSKRLQGFASFKPSYSISNGARRLMPCHPDAAAAATSYAHGALSSSSNAGAVVRRVAADMPSATVQCNVGVDSSSLSLACHNLGGGAGVTVTATQPQAAASHLPLAGPSTAAAAASSAAAFGEPGADTITHETLVTAAKMQAAAAAAAAERGPQLAETGTSNRPQRARLSAAAGAAGAAAAPDVPAAASATATGGVIDAGAAAAGAAAAAAHRLVKRVRFHESVQVFVLPDGPEVDGPDAHQVSTRAAARGASDTLPSYQQQQQRGQGRWVPAVVKLESQREGAVLKRQRAAARAAAGDANGGAGTAAAAAAAAAAQMSGSKGCGLTPSAARQGNSRLLKKRTSSRDTSSRSGGRHSKMARTIGSSGGGGSSSSAAGLLGAGCEGEEAEEAGAVCEAAFTAPDAVFSPWHTCHQAQRGVQLVKGSEEAEEVQHMLREEEGLPEPVVSALMAYLYKEARAPSLELLQTRIQRFKAVIAPYRVPAMLTWLKRNPRLLLMSASTLSSNISGTLAVLSPALMLPDDALQLLCRCPSLVPRTPVGLQSRLDMMQQVVGPSALIALINRLPVILTLAPNRFLETIDATTTMLASPGPLGQLLRARLALEQQQEQQQQLEQQQQQLEQQQQQLEQQQQQLEQQQQQQKGQSSGAGLRSEQQTTVAQTHIQQPSLEYSSNTQPSAAAAKAELTAAAEAPDLSTSTAVQTACTAAAAALEHTPTCHTPHDALQETDRVPPAEGLPTGVKAAAPQQHQQQQQQLTLAGDVPTSQQQQHTQQQQVAYRPPARQQQQQQQLPEVSPQVLALLLRYPAVFITPTERFKQRFAAFDGIVQQWVEQQGDLAPAVTGPSTAAAAAAAAVSGASRADADAGAAEGGGTEGEATGAAAAAAAAEEIMDTDVNVEVAAMQAVAEAGIASQAAAAAAGGDAGEGSVSLLSTAGSAVVPDWAVRSRAIHCGIGTILCSLMKPDSLFDLVKHRAEFILLTQQQGSMRVWNLDGPTSQRFEERFAGFAAWREQHKGVPTSVTLGDAASSSAGRRAFRRSKRKQADT